MRKCKDCRYWQGYDERLKIEWCPALVMEEWNFKNPNACSGYSPKWYIRLFDLIVKPEDVTRKLF